MALRLILTLETAINARSRLFTRAFSLYQVISGNRITCGNFKLPVNGDNTFGIEMSKKVLQFYTRANKSAKLPRIA